MVRVDHPQQQCVAGIEPETLNEDGEERNYSTIRYHHSGREDHVEPGLIIRNPSEEENGQKSPKRKKFVGHLRMDQ